GHLGRQGVHAPERRGRRRDRARVRRDPPRRRGVARRGRRGLHQGRHRPAAPAGDRRAGGARGQRAAAAVDRGHRRPGRLQDHREHGDRPQRHARPVGLDERSGDPLGPVGVGQRLPRRAVEALAQLPAPHVHERDRQGQGRRVRDPPRHLRPAVAPLLPGPAALQRAADVPVPVGCRAARPRHRRRREARRRPRGDEGQAAPDRAQGRQAGAEGLRVLPGPVRPVLPGDDRRERDGQPRPQRLGLRDHLLRALPRRRRGVHRGGARGRDLGRVVPAPAARLGELHRRQAHAPHERQPRLPDRAPPVPGPAVEPVPGDRGEGARRLRALGPALHDRAVPEAVLAVDAVDLEALAPGGRRAQALRRPPDRPREDRRRHPGRRPGPPHRDPGRGPGRGAGRGL
ncbi:MAG: Linoleoyl-CoA desaturase, partial [uncultured Actinomycetospora sp.]